MAFMLDLGEKRKNVKGKSNGKVYKTWTKVNKPGLSAMVEITEAANFKGFKTFCTKDDTFEVQKIEVGDSPVLVLDNGSKLEVPSDTKIRCWKELAYKVFATE